MEETVSFTIFAIKKREFLMSAFKSREDKRDYILFCSVVFIFSISYSTQAYLAVILKHNGFDKAQPGNLFLRVF